MSATTVSALHSSSSISSPLSLKKKSMSITQTYYLAHKARGKLSHEAARADHNLRLLVGHANLLDSLMIELADAEREQESWFNQSVRSASAKKEESRHIQWADSIVEEPEEDWDADDASSDSSSDSDSDSDFGDEDVEMADIISLRRVPSHKIEEPSSPKMEVDEQEVDDEENYAHLSLTRSPSHSASPPELIDHDTDSSEDESMPPSPPSTVLPTFSEKQRESIAAGDYEDKDQEAFYDQGFYVPPRNPARLVSAISVY